MTVNTLAAGSSREKGVGLATLDGSVVVVTGASSGIGRATAGALADLGATLALLSRRAGALREVAREIEGKGGRTLVVEADVADAAQVSTAMDRVAAEAGRIDALVNSAGAHYLSSSLTGDVQQWHQLVNVNVLGVLHCSQAALPHLLRSAEGPRGVADIVNVGSVASLAVRADNGVYAATKQWLAGFSESLRKEFAGRHLRVCVVRPGMVATAMTANAAQASHDFTWLEAADIADSICHVLTRPRRAAINDLVIRPTEQER
jgi:NADP-dependent 3-hydroxy acid dehydrogenase YdfG